MQEFEKQSEMMNMKEEMMNDVMDDAMDDEDEEETENVVNKVLAELGLENMGEVNTIPSVGEDPKCVNENFSYNDTLAQNPFRLQNQFLFSLDTDCTF